MPAQMEFGMKRPNAHRRPLSVNFSSARLSLGRWRRLALELLEERVLLDGSGLLGQSAMDRPLDDDLFSALEDFTPASIQAYDEQGAALLYATDVGADSFDLPIQQAASLQLPEDARAWESIPGVIRNDGVDWFVVEVDTNGPVADVRFDTTVSSLIAPAAAPFSLLDDGGGDDGLGDDRVAGDNIFTSGRFFYNTSFPFDEFYKRNPDSPSGLSDTSVGTLTIEELDRQTSQFLIGPEIGILRWDILDVATEQLSTDVVISDHLINVRSDGRDTQRLLHGLTSQISSVTDTIYQDLPDAYDFFMFFSTNKVESVPWLTPSNFNAGFHVSVQENFTGGGSSPFDNSSTYGSDGRLLGLNVLDAYGRGIRGANATHELVHQWAAYGTYLGDGTGHYLDNSSVGSLVGAFEWIDNFDGTFTVNPDEGRNGAYQAAPMDKYLMGLIGPEEVPTTYLANDSAPSPFSGEPILPEHIESTVTMNNIIGADGFRTPGPADAQRDFNLAFVAESHQRLLTPTEMTYYEILADHYTKELPPEDSDPYITDGWQPITRFFGEGTTWSTEIRRESLLLTIDDTSIAENAGAGATMATVSRPPGDVGEDLLVMLASSDPSEATVPATVVIPAGQPSVSFPVDAIDDELFDGPQAVTVTALAYPFVSTGATLDVTDNEPQPSRQIRGTKFNDFDGDGIWDGNEPAIAGWTIYLDANQDGELNTGETSTDTDANGDYAFDDPAAGTHYVAEVIPPGWLQEFPEQSALAPAVAASIHDEPLNGFGDTFNGGDDDRLIQQGATSEDRVIAEFGVGFLAGKTLTEATLDLTFETIDPGGGSSAVLGVYFYEGNGSADLSDFSTPATMAYSLGLMTSSAPVDFSLDFRDRLQGFLDAGGTFFGIRIDLLFDTPLALRLTDVSLLVPVDLGEYPHVVTLGDSEILTGIDFGNRDVEAPDVVLTGPALTIDPTPAVTVTATDNDVLPDGTLVVLDVDLNDDGDFIDPGESNYTPYTLTAGSATFDMVAALADGTYRMRARVTDRTGNEGTSATLIVVVDTSTTVVARHVFYNNSKWDGHAGFENGDPAANEFDDAAIATDKTALLPGQTATFANYTSYHRGINGIMVDVRNLIDPSAVADDDFSEFTFKVGNSNDLTEWLPAPDPADVDVRDLGGDVYRVTFIWADNAVPNKNWLQVTVKQHAATGLEADDVFYFGNSSGENTGDFRVDYGDAFDVIWPLLFTSDPIGVDHAGDVNRDGRIDYGDVFDAVWPNLFGPSPLVQLTAPAAPAAPPESAGSVFGENRSWAIEVMWFDELYGNSSNSEEEEDDPLEATSVDSVFSMYYEE